MKPQFKEHEARVTQLQADNAQLVDIKPKIIMTITRHKVWVLSFPIDIEPRFVFSDKGAKIELRANSEKGIKWLAECTEAQKLDLISKIMPTKGEYND